MNAPQSKRKKNQIKMKKPTTTKAFVASLFLLIGFIVQAQTYEPFTLRENLTVRGSMVVIGNAILGQDNNDFNFTNQDNQDIDMQYIDIDSDASTFSSSSADLVLQDRPDGTDTNCYRVAYAGLYWAGIVQDPDDRSEIANVKSPVRLIISQETSPL